MKLSKVVAKFLRTVRAMISGAFDVDAYSRFLQRERITNSREAYARFLQERRPMQERRPRCC